MRFPRSATLWLLLSIGMVLGCPAEDDDEPPVATAEFTVTKSGTGTGTVASLAGGFNCGPACPAQTETLLVGSDFSLTATAEAGSTFAGWSGAGCQTTTAATTTANVAPEVLNNTCHAEFNLLPGQTFTLQIAVSGTGSGTVTSQPGTINCPNRLVLPTVPRLDCGSAYCYSNRHFHLCRLERDECGMLGREPRHYRNTECRCELHRVFQCARPRHAPRVPGRIPLGSRTIGGNGPRRP